MDCMMCGGEVFLLGQLGDRVHVRCRDCGIDASFVPEDRDDPPNDPDWFRDQYNNHSEVH